MARAELPVADGIRPPEEDLFPVLISLSGGEGRKVGPRLSRICRPRPVWIGQHTGDDFGAKARPVDLPRLDTSPRHLAGLATARLDGGRHDETWSFMIRMEARGW